MIAAAADHQVSRSVSAAAALLLVDKPAGMTSHDVVALARRVLRERRIGHHGTLDPFATGLLVLLVGRATRLAPWLAGEPKVYRCTIRFGAETDTDDLQGSVVREAPLPRVEDVLEGVRHLTGELHQVPPSYSAKQVEGVRAYDAARRGTALELAPVSVRVDEWVVEASTPEQLVARITCGGGTYIRALARDLGRLAGSAAHLTDLRRLSSGPLRVEDAVTIDRLRDGEAPLRSPMPALAHMDTVTLDGAGALEIAHGRAIAATSTAENAALLAPDGVVIGIAERRGDRWMPRVVLTTPEEVASD